MTHLHLLCFTAAVQERPESLREEFLAQMTKITVLCLVFKNFDSQCLFFFSQKHLLSSHRIHLWISVSAALQGFLPFPVRKIIPLWGDTRYVLQCPLYVCTRGISVLLYTATAEYSLQLSLEPLTLLGFLVLWFKAIFKKTKFV